MALNTTYLLIIFTLKLSWLQSNLKLGTSSNKTKIIQLIWFRKIKWHCSYNIILKQKSVNHKITSDTPKIKYILQSTSLWYGGCKIQ